MSDITIFERNDTALSIVPSEGAVSLKNSALASSATIVSVETAEENETAVKVQAEVNSIVKAVEKSRKELKEPVLTFGRKIDETAKNFSKELDAELVRISVLIGDFAALENARAKASEALGNIELEEIERERQKALASATTHKELDEINERFDRGVAAISITAPIRAKGQIVKSDWKIEIINAHLLAKCHPTCVNITPRLSDIKELLNLGVEVKGIRAEKIVTATVRPVANKMIEV
jgi:hypothetical protein